MKKAVEAGLKVYPPQFSSGKRFAKRVQGEMVDTRRPIRTIFMRGYSQSQQDIVNVLVQIEADTKSGGGVNNLHSCDIEYVHQLQHALRICGIEKEIEL